MARRQTRARGFALVAALLLLVVLTLVAFAGLRGTLLQQKMSAHQYDRQIAFQHAEAALRVAQSRLISHPEEIARNCQSQTVACLANPFNDPGLPKGSIHTVDSRDFTVSQVAPGQPQYVIENMGDWIDPEQGAAEAQSANARNYGSHSESSRRYYRITARSSDPAITDGRVLVILQATLEQRR